MPEDLTDQQVCYIASREVTSQRRESDHLREPVHEDHYAGVAPDSERKVCNEVHTHTLPFLFRDRQRLQQACWTSPLVLHTETSVTCAYVLLYVLFHSRPPKEPSRQVEGSFLTKVTSVKGIVRLSTYLSL